MPKDRYRGVVHLIEVKQRMGEEDIAAVSRLLRAAERVDDHAPLGEHKWLDLVQGGRAGFAGFVARELGHERVIGYAQIAKGTTSWSIEYVIHPSIRHNDTSVATMLLEDALREIAQGGGGHVHLWVPKPTQVHDEIAQNLGFRRGRELYQMRRALPLEDEMARVEIPTRPFRSGIDDAEWLALNQKVFADHPEQGAWKQATLDDRIAQSWFDADGFLLHETAGMIDGFCWTKVHEEGDDRIGEVYVVGVDPDRRRNGLGRALVLAGLTHLARTGIDQAMLYVDAANSTAVSLYADLGFRLDHIDLAYLIDVGGVQS